VPVRLSTYNMGYMSFWILVWGACISLFSIGKWRMLQLYQYTMDQCWVGVYGNAWYQQSTPIRGSKNLTKIVIPIKYWNLVGRYRWENLPIRDLLLGAYHSNHIDIRGISARYKGTCMDIYSNAIEKQKYPQISISYWYQKIWNPHYTYPSGMIKNDLKTLPVQHWYGHAQRHTHTHRHTSSAKMPHSWP
jgi:hypothetical protein